MLKIIAEAAQGFEGDPTLARLLVRAAAAGHADIVKFQLVYADELATPAYEYFELFRSLEMPDDAWRGVAKEASTCGLQLAFDVFGIRSLKFALELGASAVKLHVSDFFNEPLFEAAIGAAPHVYFSVGGITEEEVKDRLAGYDSAIRSRLTMMIGFQAEPTRLDDNHVGRLATWRHRFPDIGLGFMDHADGDGDEAGWLGVLAVALGASVVEKHVTLDRAIRLEDYVSAATPVELARYSKRLRNARVACGTSALELSEPERQYRARAVKVLVANRDLPAGACLKADDLRLLRSPLAQGREALRFFGTAVGRTLVRSVVRNAVIYSEDVAGDGNK